VNSHAEFEHEPCEAIQPELENLAQGTSLDAAEFSESGGRESPHRETRPLRPLTSKHGIGNASRLSLWRRLRLKLPSRRRRDGAIRRLIGDSLERIGDAGQFERNLVGSVRPFQHDDAFAAEVKGSPKQQTNHHGYARHEYVMARNSDTSARNANHVIREQSFLPAGVSLALRFG